MSFQAKGIVFWTSIHPLNLWTQLLNGVCLKTLIGWLRKVVCHRRVESVLVTVVLQQVILARIVASVSVIVVCYMQVEMLMKKSSCLLLRPGLGIVVCKRIRREEEEVVVAAVEEEEGEEAKNQIHPLQRHQPLHPHRLHQLMHPHQISAVVSFNFSKIFIFYVISLQHCK